jgi:hypothetical protein
MQRSTWLLAGISMMGACQGAPEAPLHPTWADVQPILQGQCNHCHGATARTTGSIGPAAYRFDFYDMTDEVCGDAAAAMDYPALAKDSASLMKADLRGVRPKMPPAPAPELHDWERDTLLRWADAPVKGPPPEGNRRPRIHVNRLPSTVGPRLSFIAQVEDPDADSVIGLIRFGDQLFKMDHPGAYQVDFDMSSVPRGTQRLTAILCDGWANATYDLGPIEVAK